MSHAAWNVGIPSVFAQPTARGAFAQRAGQVCQNLFERYCDGVGHIRCRQVRRQVVMRERVHFDLDQAKQIQSMEIGDEIRDAPPLVVDVLNVVSAQDGLDLRDLSMEMLATVVVNLYEQITNGDCPVWWCLRQPHVGSFPANWDQVALIRSIVHQPDQKSWLRIARDHTRDGDDREVIRLAALYDGRIISEDLYLRETCRDVLLSRENTRDAQLMEQFLHHGVFVRPPRVPVAMDTR